MALDWNQEVSLATIMDIARPGKGGSKGSATIPTKTTMNLYQPETKTINLRKAVILLVLALILIGVFVKFGVIDQFAALSQKQAQLEEQQAILIKYAGSVEGYKEVQELYEAYVAQYGSDTPDAIAVLEMVEKRVMGKATVTGITLSGETLTLTMEDVSLETVGDLASDLEKEPTVKATNVMTATAQSEDTQKTVSTLVVTLVGTQGEEDK